MGENGLIYVPGSFVCPKCRFHLISKNLYLKSGTVGPKASGDREPCPDCFGVFMEPQTWKAHAESLEANSEQSFKNGYALGFRTAKKGKPFNEYFGPVPDDLR
jgi:hypothetical protein